jgi:predicted small metal-binding protein
MSRKTSWNSPRRLYCSRATFITSDEGCWYLPIREDAVGRKFIDCRAFPGEMNCLTAMSADTEGELLEAAVQHSVAVHEHRDTPELRDQTRDAIRDGVPPEEAPGV